MKRKLINLAEQRTTALAAAETALNEGRREDYDARMAEVSNLNTEISRVQNLIAEQERVIDARQPTPAEARDMAEERGNALMNHREIRFTTDEVRRALRNATTLASTTLAQPLAAGADIRDTLGAAPSILDQVYVQDLSGTDGIDEPYVVSGPTAQVGTIANTAGTARTASDPTFAYAKIRPYNMDVTTFVDRNISRLTLARYYEKCAELALKALRKKLAALIVNGDGEATRVFYGMKNGLNAAGGAIYATLNVTALDVNTANSLYFEYGGTDMVGAGARLFCNKADLKAFGALRGTNEKGRLFSIAPDPGSANMGTLSDGGVILPYTLCPDLTALSATAQGAAAVQTMIYGDPINYELGLFGDYSIRIDESVKAVERMVAILGDAIVGGNIIIDKGFVVATVPAAD